MEKDLSSRRRLARSEAERADQSRGQGVDTNLRKEREDGARCADN